MDIRYSDEDVRGERSNHPDKSNRSDKEIELFFTEKVFDLFRT